MTNPARGRSARDVVLSLTVLLVPLLLVLLVVRVVQGDRTAVVDPAPAVAEATAAGRFPAAVPQGLGPGWRPVSATYRTGDNGGTLRIGYLTPDGAGVQMVLSDVPAETLLRAELGELTRPRSTETVAGRAWQQYAGRPGETALVLTEPGRTAIVLGAAPLSDLHTLAAGVR